MKGRKYSYCVWCHRQLDIKGVAGDIGRCFPLHRAGTTFLLARRYLPPPFVQGLCASAVHLIINLRLVCSSRVKSPCGSSVVTKTIAVDGKRLMVGTLLFFITVTIAADHHQRAKLFFWGESELEKPRPHEMYPSGGDFQNKTSSSSSRT